MRVFMLLGFILSLQISAAATREPSVVPFEENGVVTGVLRSTPECVTPGTRERPQVWLSVGQILLYQVEIPENGSYEFHVIPGKYELVASNSKGCLAQKDVLITPKQVAQVDLKIEPSRAPASLRR